MEIKYREKLKNLPEKSGVYIMLDEYGNILYVGKAKILKNRVRQYFHHSVKNEKTAKLVEKIADFRYIITQSEYEALILENNLIKENNPPYNILLKDDHTYPYIKINVKEKFPRIEVAYRLKSDGAKYFGPYMLGMSVRDLIGIIQTVYPLRTCRNLQKKECLNYHINRCFAPCTGKITEQEYAKLVGKVISFLNGNDGEARKILQEKMQCFAEREEFEQAKYYRDTLNALDKILRKQSIFFKQEIDIDVFTFVTNGVDSAVNCFAVRGGKYLGGTNFRCADNEYNNGLTSFIMQYYQNNPIICSEILVSGNPEFKQELEDYISSRAGKKIPVTTPIGGIRKQLVELGIANGEEFLSAQLEKQERIEDLTYGATVQLKEKLGLDALPKRIECYDISHISGTNKAASMVVFINGDKAPNMYRRFKIKTVEGNNDFACMYETLARRFQEMKKGEDVSFSARPDLIIIDGGKGQLAYAVRAADDCGVNVNVVSLAKREEEIFIPGREESVLLPRTSLALKLVIRIRDEAHRFAITFHRNLRTKMMTESELEKIEGIGKTKGRNLIIKFKRLENIEKATDEELSDTQSINKTDIKHIREYFERKKSKTEENAQ
jgi:excinuclease ABC subunit C